MTVSATGMSSRYSSRVSNDRKTERTASSYDFGSRDAIATSARATAALRQWLADQAFVSAVDRPQIAKQQIVIVSASASIA